MQDCFSFRKNLCARCLCLRGDRSGRADFWGLRVVKGTTVERLLRHSRAFRIFDGTSEIQQLIIARNLLTAR
ncbi:MAG TPA: acyl-CoA dehydrogenase family protein [Bradyrhizobium sp.]|nr:acyl-CoA dehydrogenase family protein [Bradyrhizobium sp.]